MRGPRVAYQRLFRFAVENNSIFFDHLPGRQCLIAIPLLQIEFDRNFTERKLVAQYAQQVSSVAWRESFGLVTDHDNGGRLRTDLCAKVNLRAAVIESRWRISLQRHFDQGV